MNLDIMTLMAASAAVTDTGSAAADATASAGREVAPEGIPFSTLLQAVIGESRVEFAQPGGADVEPAPGAIAAAADGESTELLVPLAGRTDTPPGQTGSGEALPVRGDALPPLVSDELPDRRGPAMSLPDPRVPAGLGQSAPRAAPVPGEPGLSQSPRPTRAERIGWFSTVTPPVTPESADDGVPLARVETDPVQTDVPRKASGLADALASRADLPDSRAPAGSRPATSDAATLTQLATRFVDQTTSAAPMDSAPEMPRSIAPDLIATSSNAASSAPRAERLPQMLPVTQPGWDRTFADQITVMASRGLESAELRLDPPQLGTLHVKLTLQGDQAQLMIQSGSGVVRDLVETALPRLRELLGQEGLTLDGVQVADRESAQRNDRHASDADTPGGDGQHGDEPDTRRSAKDDDSRSEETREHPGDQELTSLGGRLHVRV